jgi:hypothetical protein
VNQRPDPPLPTHVRVPALITEIAVDRNAIRQISVRGQSARVGVDPIGGRFVQRDDGSRLRFQSRRAGPPPPEPVLVMPPHAIEEGIAAGNLASGRWYGGPARSDPSAVLDALDGSFAFAQEDRATGRPGLRPPQLGALHAVLAHWTTNSVEPATVVMPTGTGKTETMLTLLCASRPSRLLVVVPSDALRRQSAAKFETLGVLPSLGVVPESQLLPVVGQVSHRFSSPGEAIRFADACNVIVATPAALYASPHETRRALLDRCSHLFVDEAHHVASATWAEIRDDFDQKPVVQFTATPFREDGRHLGGRLVYAYPLREAQKNGYFSQLGFISVLDLGDHDRSIARRAIARLREDLAAGHDHLIMARVMRVSRAPEVLALYEDLAPDLGVIPREVVDKREPA